MRGNIDGSALLKWLRLDVSTSCRARRRGRRPRFGGMRARRARSSLTSYEAILAASSRRMLGCGNELFSESAIISIARGGVDLAPITYSAPREYELASALKYRLSRQRLGMEYRMKQSRGNGSIIIAALAALSIMRPMSRAAR